MQRIARAGAPSAQRNRRLRHVLVTSAVSAALVAFSPFASAGLTHEYSFNGNVNDSVGGANGTLTGSGGYNGDNTALIFNGFDTYVTLPNNILPSAVGNSATIEVFGSYDTDGGGWERIFDIGGGTANNFFFTPKSGPGDTRLRIKTPPTNGESGPLLPGNLATGEVLTLTAVLDGAAKTLSLYRNGGLLSTDPITSSLDQLLQTQDYIGKSQFADPLLKGAIDEFRIYDNAAAQYQVVINHYLGPNTMTLSATNSLSASGNVDWTDGSAWNGGHAPTSTELASIANGATVNVTSDVGVVPMVQLTKGTLNVSGGAITGGIDLAPGSAGPVTLNISNGGVVNTPRIFIDSGSAAPGAGAKTINFDNGTLHTTGAFALTGSNVAVNIASGGAIFDTEFGTLSLGTVGVSAPTTILTKQGNGALALTSGFAGALNIRVGTLAVSGNLTSTATHQLGDGNVTASLQFNGPSVVTGPLIVGNDSFSGNYSIVGNADAPATFNAPITLNRSVTIAQVATTGNNALNIGAIDGGSGGGLVRDLTFNNVGLVNVTGPITDDNGGPIDVIKNNTGKVVFSGANTYHNGTTINTGILQFNSAAAVPGGVGGGQVILINAAGIASPGPAFTTGLQAGLLDRVISSSTGTIALTTDTADNLDFTNLPTAFLGATTNVTYSGLLTAGNASYQLGGGGGTLNIAGNNALTGPNTLVVGGGTAGKVVLSGNSNDYSGGTTLKSNVLAIDKPAQLGAGPLTFSGGTLDVIGAAPFNYSGTGNITAASTIQVDNTAGATFSGSITSAVAGTLFKTGPGNLIITGTVNTGTGSFHPRAGTVTIDTGGSVTTGNFVSIGLTGGDVGTVVAKGNGKFIVNGDFNISDIANTVGYLYIQDTATVSGRTIYIGKSVNALGTVVQTGGTFNGVGGGGDWRIGGNGSATDVNAVGTYDLAGGTFSTANNFQIGAFGQGAMTMTGGTASSTGGFAVVGRFVGGYGVLTINGGTFTQVPTGQFPIIGEQGTGTLNVGGPAGAGGTFQANGAQLRIGHNAGIGVVNLGLNGTIKAKAVNVGTGAGTFNLHGGTLQALAASGAFIANTNSYVWPEGGIIDSNGFDLTIAAPLTAPTGSGVASIALTSGGTGYVGSPIVKLTGGGGAGASAIPVIAGGQVTGITITNPGVGYTSAPTVQILGGGGTNAAAGAINLVANGSGGGITKNGIGTLTLSAANTYTGNTTVNAGTVRVTGSLAGGVIVNNSGLFDAAIKQSLTSLAVNSGGTATVSVGPLKVGNNSAPLPLSVAPNGKLDLKSTGIIVDYQSTGAASDNAALASLRTPLKAGFGPNGDWKGASGITSATAAANALGAVGYALASDVLPFTNGATDTFLGVTVDKSSVLARYTLAGDVNLDGKVDFLDLAKLAQSYNVTDGTRQWSTGDVNYDGNTDFLDLAKLAQNYNTALPSSSIPGASAAFEADLARAFASVPEPSTTALAFIAACGLAAQRRRRRRRT